MARKMPKLPGFDQHLPSKCSVFPLLFGAEHYQSLEIALTNVGLHYLKVDFSILSSVTTLRFDNGPCFEKPF
jgi:hypothetical protein